MATFDYIAALCSNDDNLSESELVSTLRATQFDPSVLYRRGSVSYTLLHIAAKYGRSPEFCSVLHELDVTLVKSVDNRGWLPFHDACKGESLDTDTAKYLLNKYPESINIPDDDGWYSLHLLTVNYFLPRDKSLQFLAFLLKHDKG